MQIQVIEKKTGLDRATIRYYEKEGLISPKRLPNGYRDYSEENIQDLCKIKLLRQLGLSLETIILLIEGKEDLQSVLDNQLSEIENHKLCLENAETICKTIMKDKVTYQTIEPRKYYNMVAKKEPFDKKIVDVPETDYVYLESHPWRRFVGRYLDQFLVSGILMMLIVVILRIRPFGNIQSRLLSIAAVFLVIPINALFLCTLGTTPGKFAMGIFMKTPEGKNMSFLTALRREWFVFRYGMGFTIPIYSWIRLYKSYNIHKTGLELEWDYECDTDVLYTQWETKRLVYGIILGICSVISIFYSSNDSQFPKHRNAELTLAQFAENFNGYAKLNDINSTLTEQGEWYTPDPGPNTIVIETFDNDEYWQFITDENQILKEIKIKIDSDTRLFFFGGGKKSLAIFTAIMSQPKADINTADEAMKELSEVTFITDLKENHYDFDGVIVDLEIRQANYNKDEPAELLVNIKLP